MFGSDWIKLAKAVGLGAGGLAAFLFALFVGYQLGASGGYYDAEHSGYAAQYPYDTDKRINGCFADDALPSAVRQCIEEAIKSGREYSRAESDLSAQRKMADWAFWLLVATLGTIPLTAAGLVLVLHTIWQGREGLSRAQEVNRIAEHSAKKHLAPYMDLKSPELNRDITQDVAGWLGYITVFKLKNFGPTPAHQVRYCGSVNLCEGDSADFVDDIDALGSLGWMNAGSIAQTDSIRILISFHVPELHAEDVARNAKRIMLTVHCRYRDSFGDEHDRRFEYVSNNNAWSRPAYVDDDAD